MSSGSFWTLNQSYFRREDYTSPDLEPRKHLCTNVFHRSTTPGIVTEEPLCNTDHDVHHKTHGRTAKQKATFQIQTSLQYGIECKNVTRARER